MATIKNMNEVLEIIVDMMMTHDKQHTSYQQDIYLYMHDDGTAAVELFANVGGNSWLNDDHYTVMRLMPTNTIWDDYYQTYDDIANGLGWDKQTLFERAASWYSEYYDNPADASDMSYGDIYDFIKHHEPLLDTLEDGVAEQLEDQRSEYAERAQMALDAVLEEINERGEAAD